MPTFVYAGDDRTYPYLPVKHDRDGQPTEVVAFEATDGAEVEADQNPDETRFSETKPKKPTPAPDEAQADGQPTV